MTRKQFNLEEERTLMYERLNDFTQNYSALQFSRQLRTLFIDFLNERVQAGFDTNFNSFLDGLQEWFGILDVATNMEIGKSSFTEDDDEEEEE